MSLVRPKDYVRQKSRIKTDGALDDWHEEQKAQYVVAADQRRDDDVALLDRLIVENVWPAVIAWAKDRRTWLLGAPRRSLGDRARRAAWKTLKTIAVYRRKGEEPPPQPEGYTVKARSKRWEKPSRPAWMDDPSLLPKRPPGAP